VLTLQLTPPDLDADGRASPDELAAGTELLRRFAPTWLTLMDADGPVGFVNGAAEPRPAEALVIWRAEATRSLRGSCHLQLHHLDKLTSGHREFVTITSDGNTLAASLLSSESPSLDFTCPSPSNTTDSRIPPTTPFLEFLHLGVVHILTGYDHLLYLAALLIGCRRFDLIVPIVTAFTLAHSVTLAIATLGWVTPPTAFIEPLIAASIVYVALENLWLRGRTPRFRWAVALGFGLVHGFGFAGLLQELGVGADGGSVIPPLLAFNLGVELGQLVIIAAVLPLLAWGNRRPRFVSHGLPAASGVVATIGLIWFIQRVSI
jgi:hypothetical protein